MPIFRITLPKLNPKTGDLNFWNFECDARSVPELAARLNDEHVVVGKRLRTRGTGRDQPFEVFAREEVAIGRRGVAFIEIMSDSLFVDAR